MVMRRVKFVWGSADTIRGRWYFGLFGLYNRHGGGSADGFAVSVRGLLVWSGIGAGVAYVLAATALFWVWDRDPYSMRTYGDAVLWPIRRGEIQRKNGQALLARGVDAMRAQRWADGTLLLRQGLTLAPGDWSARMTLAHFYAGTNQRAQAVRLLGDGLGAGYPGRARLSRVFALASQAEDFSFVAAAARRFLPHLAADASLAERRWLFAQEIGALLAEHRLEEAEVRLHAAPPGLASREQRVAVQLRRRRFDEAIAVASEWRGQPGADAGVVGRLAARIHRETGRGLEMEAALAAVRAHNPADPEGWAFTVQQRALAAQPESARVALDEYLFRFGGTSENLQLVGAMLGDTGMLSLVQRCSAAAAERGYPLRPFQILLATTSLHCGEWALARGSVAAIAERRGSAGERAWKAWMTRLIDAAEAKGDGAVLQLTETLRTHNWPAETFHVSIRALRRAEQLDAAREVLAVARRMFPASVRFERDDAEVRRAIAARAPAEKSEVMARTKLPAESAYFQQLAVALEQARWDEAADLIRQARGAQPEPEWLRQRDGELRHAEMRTARGRGERSRLLAAAGLFANGDAARSRLVLDFAREVQAEGDTEQAAALVALVLQRSPEDRGARGLMAAWQPLLRPAK